PQHVLNRPEDVIYAIDNHRRVGEHGEEARQLELELVPVRELERIGKAARLPREDLVEVDRGARSKDVVAITQVRVVERHLGNVAERRVELDLIRERPSRAAPRGARDG